MTSCWEATAITTITPSLLPDLSWPLQLFLHSWTIYTKPDFTKISHWTKPGPSPAPDQLEPPQPHEAAQHTWQKPRPPPLLWGVGRQLTSSGLLYRPTHAETQLLPSSSHAPMERCNKRLHFLLPVHAHWHTNIHHAHLITHFASLQNKITSARNRHVSFLLRCCR